MRAPGGISALVVARNEEAQLDACLGCLGFADELVVVLDRCTDGSREIAAAHGACILEGDWPVEGQRRNAGIQACTQSWVLEVDADERISSNLAVEIRAAIAWPGYSHFLIPVDNYVGERLVRYGWGASFGTMAVARLFTRDSKRYKNQRVHPGAVLSGRKGRLRAPLQHHVDHDISGMLMRLDRYTTLRAQDLRDNGNIGSLRGNLRRIPHRFWKCYVRRQGWREGRWGLLIAMMAALYPILSYLKASLEPGPESS